MNHITAKTPLIWIFIIAVFSFGFYLSSQRDLSAENNILVTKNAITEKETEQQDNVLKQKLADDFEIAFLKQYTPLVGCEDFHIQKPSSKCSQHLEQAKNDFKDEFIKNRGLPKHTFEELKLSFIE